MSLFKKKKNSPPALLYSLDKELEYARARKETSFYYYLMDNEIDQAMAWGVKNRVGIQPDHITDGKLYYKFYGFSLDN